MTFKSSNRFRDFDRSVRRELRYMRTPAQDDFLNEVLATSEARKSGLKTRDVLWRAQLGHDWRKEKHGKHTFQVPDAYPPKRMKPLPEKASDGRANPKGIACLYLATRKETAVLEVRPLIGSYVSVAQFRVLRDLQLINCSTDEGRDLALVLKENLNPEDLTPEDIEKSVWSAINRAFSEPAERGDESVDYVPTQILAEAFKRHGFDGIAYKSSYGEEGLNVALFDIEAADLINCQLYRIDDVKVTMSAEDNPYFVSKYYEELKKPPKVAGGRATPRRK